MCGPEAGRGQVTLQKTTGQPPLAPEDQWVAQLDLEGFKQDVDEFILDPYTLPLSQTWMTTFTVLEQTETSFVIQAPVGIFDVLIFNQKVETADASVTYSVTNVFYPAGGDPITAYQSVVENGEEGAVLQVSWVWQTMGDGLQAS